MANQAKIGDTVFHVGDTIGVHYKLIEKEKISGKAKKEVKEETRERVQIFEGIVLSIRGSGPNKTFMVRRISVAAIGVERIFPLNSPWIKKITVKKRGQVRRAKLFYLRDKEGKEAENLKEKVTQGKLKGKKANPPADTDKISAKNEKQE